MASCPAGKSSWPELVSVIGEVAAAIVMAQNPRVKASIVEEGSFVTTEFRCERVRIFVDRQGIVKRVPRIG